MNTIKKLEELIKKWKDKEVHAREEGLLGSEAEAISIQRGIHAAIKVLKKRLQTT